MSVQTYLSTDWLEVGGIGSSTMVKVVLTDESEAYLISVANANGEPEAELGRFLQRSNGCLGRGWEVVY